MRRERVEMIRQFTRKTLEKFGWKAATRPASSASGMLLDAAPDRSERNSFIALLRQDPLNPGLHLRYADYASKAGYPYLAYAELKTAQALGADPGQIASRTPAIRAALPDVLGMSHNEHFRFSSVCSEIVERSGASNVSVLDVGGGEGRLAAFIPDACYCLAEPTVNGISGTSLPFADHTFDYVVSCHVLEHIDVGERAAFLDHLVLKARRGVILLNPFHVAETCVEDRLKLILDITGAPWAREHLECTLPEIRQIEAYARERGLEIDVKPNGTMALSLAFVFVDHFAGKSGALGDWQALNRFFNDKYGSILHSDRFPNAYLVYLGRR